MVDDHSLRVERTLLCPACNLPTRHDLRFEKNGCDILACRSCGLGRAETAVFDAPAYYTDAYFKGGYADGYADYTGSEAVLRREFKASVEYLSRFVSSGRLLEIGCAYGFFLLEAQSRFDVFGIEIAEEAVRFCHHRGLVNVRCGLFDEAAVRDLPSMDAIVLLDVIEHLPDPNEVFRLLASKLSPQGALLLTTGDWNSILARVAGLRWRLMMPPQHLFYFTPRSLRLLGQHHGLVTQSIRCPWKTIPLSLVLYQLQRMLGIGNRPLSRPRLLSGVGIPLNLFDAIRVVYTRAAAPPHR